MIRRMLMTLSVLGLMMANLNETAGGVKVGDPAPKFEAPADDGSTFKLEDHLGEKYIVVYFYPADLTGGCTKQACGFRDDLEALTEKDVMVVGISGDSVRNHQLFKKVHMLNFPLLADEKGEVAKLFGVPVKEGGTITREIDGVNETLTRGVTTARWTILIDKQGKIALINSQVNAAEDSKAILKAISERE